MTTRSDVLTLLKKIGTKEYPVRLWNWLSSLGVTTLVLYLILAAPRICPSCDFGVGSYALLTSLAIITVGLELFLVYGIYQYTRNQ
jgi:hypothetical protein